MTDGETSNKTTPQVVTKLNERVLLGLYTTSSFATSAGITRAVMLVVPTDIRPFAIGFLTVILHALGDVPSPPIVGCRLMIVPLPSQSAIVSITRLAKAALDYLLLGSKSFRQTRVG